MGLIVKNYQRIAIDKLKKFFSFYIEQENGLVVFKAPTGSGKTFMACKFMEEVCEEQNDLDFCFIWASIGWADLQVQSFESATDYLSGNPVCTLMDQEFFGNRKVINRNEIVFVNWEKLVNKDNRTGNWKNSLMKDQEGVSFLNLISETKNLGRKIILIVDEAHRGTQAIATRINEFRETIISPTFTIEMSATPMTTPNIIVKVQDVIDEGIIKKDIIVNEGVSIDFDEKTNEVTSEKLIMELGYQKRLYLLDEYKKIGSEVKPLVLIQIPNSDQGDAKIDMILDFLREKQITIENKKVKIWTSNFKLTPEEKRQMKLFNNPTEFLVFKTAVATGWDCPRAQILVKFREGKSESFEIQTIGRILRTAEAKSYDNDNLDNAYIFTNLSSFITTQDTYSPNRIKTEISRFRVENGKSVYSPIDLISFYRSREGDYNSADTEFYSFFDKVVCDYFGFTDDDIFPNVIEEKLVAKGVKLNATSVTGIMTQTGIEILKIDESQTIQSDTSMIRMSDDDIQAAFYNLIKENLSGLAYVRSKDSISGAIVETFLSHLLITDKIKKIIQTQKLFLNNSQIFVPLLADATTKFREYLGTKKGKKGIRFIFNIEPQRLYSKDTFTIHESKLSLYQPLRVQFKDENGELRENYLESSFIDYLDRNSDLIEWFWENGAEQTITNFGIGYNKDLSTFQPDFIVKFRNGKIGIFDTKPTNQRIEDTKLKSNALQEYLCIENKRRQELGLCEVIGGIIISNSYNATTKRYTNFLLFNESKFAEYEQRPSKWIPFDAILRS